MRASLLSPSHRVHIHHSASHLNASQPSNPSSPKINFRLFQIWFTTIFKHENMTNMKLSEMLWNLKFQTISEIAFYIGKHHGFFKISYKSIKIDFWNCLKSIKTMPPKWCFWGELWLASSYILSRRIARHADAKARCCRSRTGGWCWLVGRRSSWTEDGTVDQRRTPSPWPQTWRSHAHHPLRIATNGRAPCIVFETPYG